VGPVTTTTPVKRYGPTSGAVTGVLGLLICGAVAVLAALEGTGVVRVRLVVGALLAALLIWAYLLRPRVVLDEAAGTVLLRNAFLDHRVALVAIRDVRIRAVTVVTTDDGRFTGIGVGRTLRKKVRRATPAPLGGLFGGFRGPVSGDVFGTAPAPVSTRPTDLPLADLVADQVLAAADRARTLAPRTPSSVEAPAAGRVPALAELVLLAILAGALVVAFLV
jgi:hypothetical protein